MIHYRNHIKNNHQKKIKDLLENKIMMKMITKVIKLMKENQIFTEKPIFKMKKVKMIMMKILIHIMKLRHMLN